MSSKPRVIRDYDKLDEALQQQVKLAYPKGFRRNLIKFTNPKGVQVSALPFETADKYYLIRMTKIEAKNIIANDDDYDIDGILKDAAKESFIGKAADVDFDENYDDL